MKKSPLILFFCLLSIGVFSQPGQKGMISVSYAFGDNVFFRTDELVGTGDQEGKGYFMLEVKYLQPINGWLNANVGVNFSRHKLETTPAFMPGIDMAPTKGSIDLMSLPVSLQADFLKYLFVDAGVMLDMDINNNIINHQSGLGFMGGVGVKYDFKSGVRLFINPFFQRHSLVSFTSDKYPIKIFDTGVKFGIGYRF